MLPAARIAGKTLHDKLTHGMRWGTVNDKGQATESAGGCFAGIDSTLQYAKEKTLPYLFVVYHGDGPDLSVEELASPSLFNKKIASQTRPWNKFEGTERSKIWVQYLLSETSPWTEVVKHLVERDEDYINNGAFIFKPSELPTKLFYNFTMAIRYPWEQPQGYSMFLHLLEAGIPPNEACLISNMFFLKPEAKGLEGPWEVQYPMSYIEQATLEVAGRFITAKPGDLSIGGSSSPNVYPLWSICPPGDKHDEESKFFQAEKTAKDRAEALSEDKNLSLEKIREAVKVSVEEQKALI